jgi:hypothetical protein
VRRPTDAIHKALVARKLLNRVHRHPDIKDNYFVAIKGDGREVVGVMLVPGDS